MFDVISGLPIHPLVVHGVVVLIPLVALGTVLMAVNRKWRKALGWWVVALAAVAMVLSWVAKESGEKLASRIGEPEVHAELGDVMPLVGFLLFAAVTAFVAADRLLDRGNDTDSAPADGSADGSADGAKSKPKQSIVVTLLAVLAVLVSAGATVQVIRVGDSGARAVWEEEIAASSPGDGEAATESGDANGNQGATEAAGTQGDQSATPAPVAEGSDGDGDGDGDGPESASPSASSATASPSASSATASPSASSATAGSYTMADVKAHDTAKDCWTTIDGKVYDVTKWEKQHPGGAERIIQLCGTDGTQAFTAEHGGQGEPARELAQFKIGTLS